MINAFTVLAATALASFACAAPLQPRDVTCVSGLYMIVARGTGEATGEGKPAQVADLVAARVPNSVSVAVDYPATALKRRALYPASVTDGINDTKQKIEDYVAACGDGSRIALIGFSQGGNVMTDLLAGGVLKPAPLSEKYRQNIVAVSVFGDPAFAANQSYNFGTNANGNNGIFTRANNDSSMKLLATYSDVLASFCDTNDIVCADGTSTAVHSAEVPTNAQAAADFIVARA